MNDKTLLPILICVSLCGYFIFSRIKDNPAHSANQGSADAKAGFVSIQKAVPDEQEADSITIQQAQVAFGPMKFGMTETEINGLPKDATEYLQFIGNYEYTVTPLLDKEGRLSKLRIKGLPKNADYINTEIKNEIANLVELISKRYGGPKQLNTFPSLSSFHPGYLRWLHGWNIGSKTIKIGIGELDTGSEYYSDCWIYDQNLHDAEQIDLNNAANYKKEADAGKF